MEKKRLNRSELFFFMYYTLFVFALFIEDVNISSKICSVLSKGSKLFVLFILVMDIILKKWKKKDFYSLIVSALIGFLILFLSGDFFWIIVILMSLAAEKANTESLFRVSFWEVVILSSIVLLLFAFGLITDSVSFRTDNSTTERHSLGFTHSLILPLILFYLMSYYVMIKKDDINLVIVYAFFFISFITYFFCNSRNGLLLTVLLAISVSLIKFKEVKKYCKVVISFWGKHIFAVCAIFSILPSLLRSKGIFNSFWIIFDNYFTNRSLLGSSAINSYGIHFINPMKYSEYASLLVDVEGSIYKGIVLDSAYLYILIRYGILMFFFVWLIFYSIYKKEKKNIFSCLVIILVAIANVTDNDLLSYGFLPFCISSINNIFATKTKKVRL